MALTPLQGQVDPGATTLTQLGSAVPGAGSAHVVACNRSVTDTTIRVQHRLLGAGSDVKQYIVYDLALPGNETFETPEFVVANTDEVWVYTNDATVSFSLHGFTQ